MILTAGIKSGFGRFVHENLRGEGLSRSNFDQIIDRFKDKSADVIVHCAFNSAKTVNTGSLYQYLYDNVLLTERLTAIPHNKFVFISTVDVYPKTNVVHKEDEVINLDYLDGLYGIMKLMSESIVTNNCRNYIILRCSTLLGKYSRKNSLIRIIDEDNCALTLTDNSTFNYVFYLDVLEFIKLAVDSDFKGIYNVASFGNIPLSEIADISRGNVKYGAYRYDVGSIDNSKLTAVLPVFNKSSREVITQFLKERQ